MMMNKYVYIKKLMPVLIILLAVPSFAQIPLLRETVWLQSTSDIYVAGEEILFKAAVLETDTYKPSILSKSLRVELINSDGELIFQDNHLLSGSELTSGIKLPSGLPTGWYHLRSYTNWMRNFPESDFSWLSFRVIHPSDLTDERYILENDSILINLTIGESPDRDTPGEICSIYTSDTEGRPLSAEGFVLSSSTDTVAWISTDNTGWGISEYNPGTVAAYKPFIRGYAPTNTLLSIDEPDIDKPKITLSDDRSFVYVRVENLKLTGSYKLFVHKTYSWYWYKESHTVIDNIEFAVPKSALPEGIVQFSFLNNTNELLADRLWSDHDPINTGARILNHSTNAGLRSKYVADYQVNTNSQDNQTNINVLVMRENPFSATNDYLPGLPGWAAGYRIPNGIDSFRAWLMNNSYPKEMVMEFFRSGSSPEIPASSPAVIKMEYFPETQNGLLSGRLINTSDSSGVEEIHLGLTILNNGTFHASVTDKQGHFIFTFPEIAGPIDYIINYIREANPELSIDIDKLYERVSYAPSTSSVKFTGEELKYLQEQAEILQLKNIYSQTESDSNRNNDDPDFTGSDSRFYGMPDLKVVVDKYITLSNIREVFYEVVPYVSIRKKGDYTIPVISGDYLYPSSYPSLVLFDGIPVYDISAILDLPPGRIKTIEVINQFYIHGNIFFSGILNIESVNRDFGGLDLPETSIIGTIDSPEISGSYSISAKSTQEKTMPVLDNILLWKPIQTDDNARISFTTGDNPGKYRIMVYGYDENGNWVCASEFFKIEAVDQ